MGLFFVEVHSLVLVLLGAISCSTPPHKFEIGCNVLSLLGFLQASNITIVLMSDNVLYSGKVSREKNFVIWWKIRFSWRKLSRIARWCRHQKMPYLQFHGENFCKSLQNLKIHKFSPSKVYLCTV